MNADDKATLYYFVVRRFPPRKQLVGKELDKYCNSVLHNEECNRRIRDDMEKALESKSPNCYGFTYDQRNFQE